MDDLDGAEPALPELHAPAQRPCKSCPYRRNVPARVWEPDEYAKLPAYDLPTARQPLAIFLCHQGRARDPRVRVCAGWAHVHGRNPAGHELLALRVALAGLGGVASPEVLRAIADYSTTVACWPSGAAAAAWGTTGPYTAASAAAAAAIVRR